VRTIIVERTVGPGVVNKIRDLIDAQALPEADAKQLFQVIETEILALHLGNIARFKLRPSEFKEWKDVQ
jgi:hypothetical protein